MIRLLVLIVVIMASMSTVFAQEKVALLVPQMTLALGENRALDVLMNCLSANCAAFDVTFGFDPAVVEVENTELGPFLGDQVLSIANEVDNEAGLVHVAATALGDPVPNETTVILKILLKASSVGTTALSVRDLIVGDITGNLVNSAAFDGNITVAQSNAASAVTGDLTFWGYPNSGETIAGILPTFSNTYPNVQVNVDIQEFNDAHARLRETLMSGGDVPDLALVNHDRLQQFIQNGGLENLAAAPYNASQYADSFVDWTWELAEADDGQVFAIPWDVGPAGFFYRRDLFEEAGLPSDPAAVAELASTWEGFLDMCEQLTDASQGRWCVTDAAEIVYSSVYVGQFFDANGTVQIDRPEVARLVNLMMEARARGLDAGVSTWSRPEWDNLVINGSVAVQYNGSWMGGFLQTWMKPENEDWAGKWGFFPVPENPAQNRGGSLLVMPAEADNKAAAWAFIESLLLNPSSQNAMFVISDAFPAFTPAYDDPIYQTPLEFYGGQPVRSLWRDIALQTNNRTVTTADVQAAALLRQWMGRILRKEATPEAGLTQAAVEIQALLPQ